MKKKVNFAGKLSLNKETIVRLNNTQMNNIRGGAGTAWDQCATYNDGCFTSPDICGGSNADGVCYESFYDKCPTGKAECYSLGITNTSQTDSVFTRWLGCVPTENACGCSATCQ